MSEEAKIEDRLYGAISLWNHAICASPVKRKSSVGTEIVRRERKRQYLEDDVERDEKCQPWNRGMFFERVSTFSVAKWFAKPERIGPLECARQGWVCTDVDTVQCQSCGVRLCFKIEEGSDEKSLGEAFHEQLLKGHKELCPWRNSPSPISFTTIPRISESLRASYRDRAKTFRNYENDINIPAETLSKLKDLCRSIDLTSGEIISMFGWSQKNQLLCCSFCNRKVGHVLDNEKKSTTFDPILEHRWWCPWIRTTRSSPITGGSIEGAGWESTVAAVFEAETIRRKVNSRKADSNSLSSPEVRVKRLRRLLQGSVVGGGGDESSTAATDDDHNKDDAD